MTVQRNTYIYAICALVMLGCLMLSGCAVGTAFEHDKHPFKLMVAPKWEPTRQGIGVIITPETEVGPNGEGVVIMPGMIPKGQAENRLTIFQWNSGSPKDLSQFEKSMGLAGDDTRYGNVKKRWEGKLAGEDCLCYDIEDSHTTMFMRIVFHSGKPYFISCAAPHDQWAKSKPVMDSMMKTFQWTD